jgi:formylglycine-generating enzyme required for sulfatase activity
LHKGASMRAAVAMAIALLLSCDLLQRDNSSSPTGTPSPPCPGMVLIKAGTFNMGSAGGGEDEAPVHSVSLTCDFWMDATEVTQSDYQSVMGSNPSFFSGGDKPAEQISWFNAIRYCNARSKRDGKDIVYDTSTWEADFTKNGYRLPTEAEWEYACRAGTTTDFYWGNGTIDEYAWYSGNSDSMTHPVAQKMANAFGLYDMCGNVWEWCNDWLGYYTGDSETDPKGDNYGLYRIVRGGCWVNVALVLRSAGRSANHPEYTGQASVGFRVVFPAR